ncbi:MAG: intradiol ring-cleavage dioxygenase [Burkholderiaceae bacterium]
MARSAPPDRTAVARRRYLRRGLGQMAGAAGLATAAAGAPREAVARIIGRSDASPLPLTPSMTEGPFYPPAFQPLPVRSLRAGSAAPSGKPLELSGRIVDANGRPLAGARVEIWQCDARGHYHHPRDGASDDRDPDFAGFGWQLADAQGAYVFETIEPVPYPGRTPHIHVRVRRDDRALVTSQMFLPERAEDNGRDFLWRALGRSNQSLALASDRPVVAGDARDAPRRLVFDLVVAA